MVLSSQEWQSNFSEARIKNCQNKSGESIAGTHFLTGGWCRVDHWYQITQTCEEWVLSKKLWKSPVQDWVWPKTNNLPENCKEIYWFCLIKLIISRPISTIKMFHFLMSTILKDTKSVKCRVDIKELSWTEKLYSKCIEFFYTSC